MSVLGDAAADLSAAAVTVGGLRAHELGESVTPPAVVVGPAIWEPVGSCSRGSMTATFDVFVVVALDDRSVAGLYDLGPAVGVAIEEQTPAVVLRATPGTYMDLPCYQLAVEYPI